MWIITKFVSYHSLDNLRNESSNAIYLSVLKVSDAVSFLGLWMLPVHTLGQLIQQTIPKEGAKRKAHFALVLSKEHNFAIGVYKYYITDLVAKVKVPCVSFYHVC